LASGEGIEQRLGPDVLMKVGTHRHPYPKTTNFTDFIQIRRAKRRRARAVSSETVSGDEPTTEELRLRQLEQERAQLRGLEHAETEADAETHLRRADKAGYLRRKLEAQQRADREADT
jgi:hypothetical protein